MLSPSAVRRPRGLRRAPAPVRELAALASGRERLRLSLERIDEHERAVLALMLFERLTPAEAASALGVSLPELIRTFDLLMRDLRRTVRGFRVRPARSRADGARLLSDERLRRAG
jgi:DNA-directed RNA polymerase specialized sigma24 family protein